jgi:hypothetical protein
MWYILLYIELYILLFIYLPLFTDTQILQIYTTSPKFEFVCKNNIQNG